MTSPSSTSTNNNPYPHLVQIQYRATNKRHYTHPDETLQSMLERFCSANGLNSTDWVLLNKQRHKITNLQQTVRQAGIEFNCQLELMPSVTSTATSSADSGVRIAIQQEANATYSITAKRHETSALPNTTLLQLLNTLQLNQLQHNNQYLQPVLNINAKLYDSIELLAQTTLASLGIKRGSALMRLTFKASNMTLQDAQQRIAAAESKNAAKQEELSLSQAQAQQSVTDAARRKSLAAMDEEAAKAAAHQAGLQRRISDVRRVNERNAALERLAKSLDELSDQLEADQKAWQTALNTLQKIVANIANSRATREQKYRALNVDAAALRSKLTQYRPGVAALGTLGFRPSTTSDNQNASLLFINPDTEDDLLIDEALSIIGRVQESTKELDMKRREQDDMDIATSQAEQDVERAENEIERLERELAEQSAAGAGDDAEYEVEAILDVKQDANQPMYLVKWQNYPLEDATWEPFENVSHCSELVDEYYAMKDAGINPMALYGIKANRAKKTPAPIKANSISVSSSSSTSVAPASTKVSRTSIVSSPTHNRSTPTTNGTASSTSSSTSDAPAASTSMLNEPSDAEPSIFDHGPKDSDLDIVREEVTDEVMVADLTPDYNISEVRQALDQLFIQDLHSDKDRFATVAELLRKITTNLLDNPQQPKYRQLPLQNKALAEKLAPNAGARAYLEFLGFKPQGNDVLTLSAADEHPSKIRRAADVLKRILVERAVTEDEKDMKEWGPIARDIKIFEYNVNYGRDAKRANGSASSQSVPALPSPSQKGSSEVIDLMDESDDEVKQPEPVLDVDDEKAQAREDARLVMQSIMASQRRAALTDRQDIIISKGKREEMRKELQRKYDRCIIRVVLAADNTIMIQANFRPMETFNDVLQLLNTVLNVPAGANISYDITLPPNIRLTQAQHGNRPLKQLNAEDAKPVISLVPTATLKLKSVNAQPASAAMLKPEWLNQRQPMNASAVEIPQAINLKEIAEAQRRHDAMLRQSQQSDNKPTSNSGDGDDDDADIAAYERRMKAKQAASKGAASKPSAKPKWMK